MSNGKTDTFHVGKRVYAHDSIIDHFCARYTPGPNVGRGGAHPRFKTPRGLICVWARDPVCNGSVMRAGDYFPPPRAIIGRTGCCPVTNLPAIRKLLVVKVWRRSRLYRYTCIMQRVIFSDRESRVDIWRARIAMDLTYQIKDGISPCWWQIVPSQERFIRNRSGESIKISSSKTRLFVVSNRK